MKYPTLEKVIAQALELDSTKAREEVMSQSDEQIDAKTAKTWAERAKACYEIWKETDEGAEKTKWFVRAEHYRHEAVEHAGTAEGGGEVLRQVIAALEPFRQ